jgi:hypothetical protein
VEQPNSFYKVSVPTTEEQEIDMALDRHKEALRDEMHALGLMFLLYFVGILLVLVSGKDSRGERVGNALIICGLIMVGIHILLGFRTRHYRNKAKPIVDAYLRKKAMPFYQELCEMFREEPGIHLHLADNGKIIVTDKRKETK